MKKLISILLVLAVLALGVVAVSADDGSGLEVEPEVYTLGDYDLAMPAPSIWFADVAGALGQEWTAVAREDAYAAVSFFAKKPFSQIRMPYWAGDPNTFEGITPGEMELCIFKADPSKDTYEYAEEDAVRREVITTDHDVEGFSWTFEQLPGGSYCFRVRLLTEEGAYIVLSGAEPYDDDVVFDIDGVNGPMEGFHCAIVFDEGEEVTPEPTPEPTDTPAPTDTPEPTAEPTDPPAEPTDAPSEPTADNGGTTSTEPGNKGCGKFIGGGFAIVALAGAALLAGMRKKH